jgi:Ca2+-binding RTX toxin-like protein
VIALLTVLAVLLANASAASAGTVSGRLVYCDRGLDCHDFPRPRLDVTYRASPGRSDELRVLADPAGVRVVDVHNLTVGPFCVARAPHDALCGPPAPGGLDFLGRTGDGRDVAFARLGTVILGRGDDVGIGRGATLAGSLGRDELRGFGRDVTVLSGGPGADTLLGASGPQILQGGAGADFLSGGAGDDSLAGSAGDDQIAAGLGHDEISAGPGDDRIRASDRFRDVIVCGPGTDHVYVSGNDVALECEIVTRGWPG